MLNIKANLSVIVNGLALCHYQNGNWEFLMPREIGDHKLQIYLRKYYKDGSNSIRCYPVADTVRKIEVKTDDKVEPSNRERFIFPGGAANHEMDSRWILNISELYGKAVKIENKTKKKYTYLSVPSGMLYSRRFPEYPKVEIIDGTTLIKTTRVAQAAAIDIQWNGEQGKTSIIDTENHTNLVSDVLRNEDVAFYEIEFDNNCDRTCAGEETDYKYYNRDLIEEDKEFLIYSVRSFLKKDDKISFIGGFLKDVFEELDLFKCRDAPCFMGECPDIAGINSLAELL